MKNYKSFSFLALMFVLFISSSLGGEFKKTRLHKTFLRNHEKDRTSAGLWVEKNTPEDFKLLTYYGNPAFFSKRFTYDGSNLNSKYEPDHIGKKPEIVIMENANKTQHSRPGSNELAEMNHPSKDDYATVKTFFKTWRNGMNFYITVLARKDVLNQITDKSLNGPLLIDYTDYRFTSGNDELASVKRNGVWGLTIHGPAEGSIILKMDPCRMIAESKASSDSVTIEFFINKEVLKHLKQSPSQSPFASLGLISKVGDELSPRRIIDDSNPQKFNFDCTDPSELVEFVIDNNQSADFDWLEVYVRPKNN